MVNAKLVALYKQFPWLIALRNEIGNPGVVKVARLDTESIQRWCGEITTEDDSYFIKGYFFNNGSLWGEVHPVLPKGLIAFVKSMFGTIARQQTIEGAARQLPMKERITDVVLFGHDLNHYGQLQLYVYRLPNEKNMVDLLSELDLFRKEEEKNALLKAQTELEEELKK